VPVKVVGVVPAAGRAMRLQPFSVSKEVLEVGGRPVLDYVVERMQTANPDEIRLVTRPEKADVVAHAGRLGLTVIEAYPSTLSQSLLAGLEGLGEDDVVLVGLPDSIWEPPEGFSLLLEAVAGDTDAVLGVFRSSEPERGDVVALEHGLVAAVHVKPANPPGDLIWGCAAATAGALQGLRRHDEPGELFDELAGRGRVRAVRFPGEFIDIGTKEALKHARELLG
jgi:NDP-sugar pyrophosphorylase family protein